MIKIYIAGPISGRKKSEYIYQFWRMERALTMEAQYKGIELQVINPATRFVKYEGSYDELMEECFRLIDAVDAVVFLDGWEKSHGANMEYGYAKAKGKDLYFEEVRHEDL